MVKSNRVILIFSIALCLIMMPACDDTNAVQYNVSHIESLSSASTQQPTPISSSSILKTCRSTTLGRYFYLSDSIYNKNSHGGYLGTILDTNNLMIKRSIKKHPAHTSGFRICDTLVSLNNIQLESYGQFKSVLANSSPYVEIDYTLKRGTETVQGTVVPSYTLKESASMANTLVGTKAAPLEGMFINDSNRTALINPNRVTILLAFNTSCPHARAALVYLENKISEGITDNIDITGIIPSSTYDDSFSGSDLGLKIPTFIPKTISCMTISNEFHNEYYYESSPTTYLISKTGEILYTLNGYSESSFDILIKNALMYSRCDSVISS